MAILTAIFRAFGLAGLGRKGGLSILLIAVLGLAAGWWARGLVVALYDSFEAQARARAEAQVAKQASRIGRLSRELDALRIRKREVRYVRVRNVARASDQALDRDRCVFSDDSVREFNQLLEAATHPERRRADPGR